MDTSCSREYMQVYNERILLALENTCKYTMKKRIHKCIFMIGIETLASSK